MYKCKILVYICTNTNHRYIYEPYYLCTNTNHWCIYVPYYLCTNTRYWLFMYSTTCVKIQDIGYLCTVLPVYIYKMAKHKVVEKFPMRARTTIGQLPGYTSRSTNRVPRNITPTFWKLFVALSHHFHKCFKNYFSNC